MKTENKPLLHIGKTQYWSPSGKLKQNIQSFELKTLQFHCIRHIVRVFFDAIIEIQ